MSQETARKAVDFLVDEFGPDGEEYHVSLTAGGEALLNYELFKFLKSYCKAKGERIGKRIGCGFGTNATLPTPSIMQELSDMGQTIYISIDGPKEAICMRPVRASLDKHYAITEGNIEPVKRGYDELAKFLLKRLFEGDDRYFLVFEPRDFLMRFLVRVLFRRRLIYRCEAARGWLGVTAKGDLYPCSSFVGTEAFKMGNVYEGIDRDKQRVFLDLVVDKRDSCKDCWARYFCGGGCYHQAYLTNGRIDEPDRVRCELIHHLIKLSVWMWASSSPTNPSSRMDTSGSRTARVSAWRSTRRLPTGICGPEQPSSEKGG